MDYAHDYLYYLPVEYYSLFELFKTNSIKEIEGIMDDEESLENLHKLIGKLVNNGMAIEVCKPNQFPEIPESLNDEIQSIQNSIIQLSGKVSTTIVKRFCQELADEGCSEVQLWIVDRDYPLMTLTEILALLSSLSFTYVDIQVSQHFSYKYQILRNLIEEFAILKKIIVFDSEKNDVVDIVHNIPPHPPLSLGEIIFTSTSYNNGKCCGIISFESLDFSGYWVNNLLKNHNGCLYKKICLDQCGCIKICPFVKTNFGLYENTSIAEVIKTHEYKKWTNIKKDDIHVCKDCEYRYNCTDCRAFVENDDLYGKPLKCRYNPYTALWE